jgi:pSer/pThr/pTyr-binding forkhead associated (FHA) protein
MPKLIATDGSQLLVEGEEVSVGRRDAGSESIDVDLGSLERGRTVSRRHARLFHQSTGWILRVEPSTTNETKVAGRALKAGEEAPLADGDEILLGAVALTFQADFDPEATMVRRAQAPAELRSNGAVFPLASPEGRRLWIGRPQQGASPQGDLIDLSSLPGSRSVSHLHAQVYRSPAGWMLHEGRTTNPTMVAGRELAPGEDVLLTDGVSIQLGRLLVTFHEIRPIRPVDSELVLETDQPELTVAPGRRDMLGLRIVNGRKNVESIQIEVQGLPSEWLQFEHPDGTRTPGWNVNLNPAGRDLSNPMPDSVATSRLVIAPPPGAQTRAGQYPITISATTQGHDPVRRVIAATIHVQSFEGLQLVLSPREAKGSSARYTAELDNASNVDADVTFVFETDPGLICKAEPERLQLVNGGSQRALIKARVKRHHWWGPRRTYGFHLTAAAGGQQLREGAALTCFPIVPEWLQGILARLFAMITPIAIPAFTLVLLLGLAYLFLRPPELSIYADAPAVENGKPDTIHWSGDRIVNVQVDPPVNPQPVAADGQVTFVPSTSQDYTVTATNWFHLPNSQKVHINVVTIKKFQPSTTQLQQENQEVQISWDVEGADSVSFDPPDEFPDPKPTGDAKVHPKGTTTYTLIAHGAGGLDVKQSLTIAVGPPTLDDFSISQPLPGTRIYPGGAVQLAWKATGATKAVLSTDKCDDSPITTVVKTITDGTTTNAIIQPRTTGDISYRLTVSNATGAAPARCVTVSVSPVTIQFDSDQPTVTAGDSVQLKWTVVGANDSTQVTIDHDIGDVQATDQKKIQLNDVGSTDFVITAKSADAQPVQKTVTVNVKPPKPNIVNFGSPDTTIPFNTPIQLSWTVENADTVEIRASDGTLIFGPTNMASGKVQDTPPGSTTYILTATNASGSTPKSFSVQVLPPGATATPVPPAPAPGAAASPAPGAPTQP